METSLFATSKSKIIAFLLLFILLYVSKETTAQCSVYGSSPSSCSFSASGGSQTVTLFLSGSGCSDYCSNPLGWISVQRTGKGIFVITASANTGVARSGSLTFDIYTNTSYTLNVSQASACSIATPTISASGPTTFCPGGSVTLTSSAGTGYLWSNGQTSQSINVNSSGSYSVQITNSNGCKSASSAAITTTISSIPSAPTISASGSTTFCPGGSVTLFSSPGTSFLWSTGATSQSISVNSSGSYSVQITNSSGCQSASSSPVTVTLNPLPSTPTISASGSTTFCPGGSVTLTSSAGSTYRWSTGATSQSISVTSTGSYTVQTTNSSGCLSASSLPVTVSVNSLPTISISGTTTINIGNCTTLTASGAWSYLWSTGETGSSISVCPTSNTTYTVTGTSGECSSTKSVTVTVAPYITMSPSVNFGQSGGVTSYWVSTNIPSSSLSISYSGCVSSASISGTMVTVNCAANITGSTLTGSVTVSGGATSATTSVSQAPCLCTANAGASLANICQGGTTGPLGGSIGGTATGGTWSSSAGGTFSPGASTLNATWSSPSGFSGQAILTLTTTGGCNTATSSKYQEVYATPTTTTVGATQNLCGTLVSGSLGGNTPSVGTGAWSQVSGPGTTTFSAPASGTSTATATAVGTYVYRWTISNGTCTASTAQVTVNYYATPTTATVGATQNLCGTLVSGSLGGNTPTVGAGAWSQVSGPGTTIFSAPASGISTATATVYGTYVYRWTISNGTCTASTAQVTVNYYATPTTATVGVTQNLCGTLVSGSLGGNTPTVGIGAWSQVSGPGTTTFSTPASGTSTATATAVGTYVYRWTISNGTCSPSTAQVTVNYYATPTTATVGATQNLCGTLVSGSLGGNTPTVGTGAWSQVSGPGTTTFSAPALGTSTATATAVGTYVYRWTISNGTCTASTAQVTVNYYATPTTATVGATQNLCGTLVSGSLGGNTPTVGTGAWSQVSGPGTTTFSAPASGTSTATATAVGTYVYKWTISNGTCTSSTAQVTVNYYATPTTATVGATQNLCGTLVSGSLGGNTPAVGTGAWSQVSGPGTTTFSAPASGTSTATATAVGTYVYRWTISNGTCTASTAQVTVNYYATPTTATVGATQNLYGTLVSGSLGGNTPTVGIGAWSQVSGPGTTTFSAPASGTSTATATVYGTYVYRWTISNGTCTPGTAQVTVNSYAPIPRALNSNMNYIQSRTILKDNVFSESIMDALTADDLQESITYFDGLGRPRQTVSWQASPAKKDIVVPVGYDNFGREDTKYLPYALTVNNNGAFVSADVAGQSTFYSGLINSTDGPNAFAKTEFESSPLNRVFKQGAPGLVWQPNMVAASDHSVKFAYGTNIASEVKRWKVAGDVLTDDGYYTAATLYKTTTWDENNDQTSGTASHTEEFKDLQGNVVLKVSTDGAIRFSTYYVYDDFELLRFVLPPKAMEDNAITGTELNDLCYHYRYDERKRMTMKQIPGADSISMVYDVRDRLVLSQDGASRTANNWLFTKYDQINRPIITGYLTSALNAGQLRAAFKNFTSPLYETSSATGNIGYSLNSSYPSSVTIAETNVLGVTYYDNYSYLGVTGFSAVTYLGAYDIDTYTDSDGTVNGYFDKVKGLVTGTKTKVLDSNEYTASAKWLYNANYYDDHYRVIQNRRSLYDGASGGVETSASLYDFPGKVKQTKQVQTFNSVTTTVDKYLTYDHAGRLTKTDQQITGDATNGKVTVAENSYNEIGQLVDKKLHNNAQQSIDYQYNIRGWLTAINNPDNLANDGTGDTYADLFAERLLYNDNSTISNLTLKNQYNGNICGIILNRRSDATAAIMKSAYGLTYDGLNRLNEATYAENTGSGYSVNLNAYNEFGITYDKNGNILTLKRNSAGTLVDNLAYTYESANKSNRLQAVADNSNNAIGFTDVTNTSDYAYDNNGNATKDLNKGITAILYNVLNLPKTVTKDANNSIVYTYTASGEKVMQATKISGITTNRYYAGLFEYDNLRALSLVKMDEGIVTKTSSTYVYEYYLKDHLGNTRITFRPGTTGPDLAQRTDYYPFGLAFTSQYIGSTGNSYLYNGKELQKALGWQVYDYGARFYDPQIGRWHVIDEKTEKYFSSSPYVYALNNPIKFVDPDGKKIRLVIRGENKQPDRTLTYNGGNAYWDDTYKKYDGKGGNITIDKTLEAYKKIEDSKDATIKKQLHTLETSKKIHWVEAPRQDGDGSGVKPFESGKLQSETKKMVEDGIPVGSVTYLDFSKESKDKFKKTEKVESTDLTLVTHEMQHQYDDDQGTNTDSYININTEENPAEIRAVNNENIVRGEEKRTTYGGKKIDPKKL